MLFQRTQCGWFPTVCNASSRRPDFLFGPLWAHTCVAYVHSNTYTQIKIDLKHFFKILGLSTWMRNTDTRGILIRAPSVLRAFMFFFSFSLPFWGWSCTEDFWFVTAGSDVSVTLLGEQGTASHTWQYFCDGFSFKDFFPPPCLRMCYTWHSAVCFMRCDLRRGVFMVNLAKPAFTAVKGPLSQTRTQGPVTGH